VLDVWNAEPFQRSASVRARADQREPLVTLRHAGQTWDVFERSSVRRARQRLDVDYAYVPRKRRPGCEISIAQRYYLADEIEDLLRRAGFALKARFGDFSGGRFTARSPQLIVLARAI
jgi:hypothetical protein